MTCFGNYKKEECLEFDECAVTRSCKAKTLGVIRNKRKNLCRICRKPCTGVNYCRPCYHKLLKG